MVGSSSAEKSGLQMQFGEWGGSVSVVAEGMIEMRCVVSIQVT